MRYYHTPLAFLAVLGISILFTSCSKPGTPVVSISQQPITKDVGGSVVGEILNGSTVEYLGEATTDSSMLKIRFNGNEGWVPKWSIVFKAKPGVITSLSCGIIKKLDSPASFMDLNAALVVAVDTIIGDNSHVTFNLAGERTDGWIRSENIGYDVKDVTFAGRLDKFSKVIADSLPQYNRLLLEHSLAGTPLSSQIAVFKVNLSDLPDAEAPAMAGDFGIALDKNSGSVALMKPNDEKIVQAYADSILFVMKEEEDDARLNWYNKFIYELPAYVTYAGRFGGPYAAVPQPWKAYLLYRLDRSPENIRKLYDTYKDLIILNLLGAGLDVNIEALIEVHDYIFSLPNYKGLCANVSKKVAAYDKSKKNEGYNVVDQRDIYAPIAHGPTMDNNGKFSTLGDWYHSFWVRRISEGNADEVYEILKDVLNSARVRADGMAAAYNPEGGENLGEVDGGEPETVVCIFQDYGMGDCSHIEFDCGDWGDADDSKLDPESKKLWDDLSISDNDGEHANPKYVGKKFEITSVKVISDVCNEGQGGKGETESILSFKLLDK